MGEVGGESGGGEEDNKDGGRREGGMEVNAELAMNMDTRTVKNVVSGVRDGGENEG